MADEKPREPQRADTNFSYEDSLEAINIARAVQKYAGGVDLVHETLGIQLERHVKWSKEVLFAAFRQILDEYGRSPNQVIYDHKKGRIALPADKLKWLGQVRDAVTRFPGGLEGVYGEIGIQPPRRKRN